jgi:hypothetical protein
MELGLKKNLNKISKLIFFLSLALLFISLHSIVSVLSGFISGGGLNLNIDNTAENEDWVFTLETNPINKGLLPVELDLSLGIKTKKGHILEINSTNLELSPSSTTSSSLSLCVPRSLIDEYYLEDTGVMMFRVSLKTFFGLVGLENELQVGAENEF